MTNDALAQIQILQALTPDQRVALAGDCTWRNFAAKQVILEKQDASRDFFLVTEGKVLVTNYSLTGKEISFQEVGAGDYVGELSAIDGEPRSATVTALSACRLAVVSSARFHQLLDDHPSVAKALLKGLARVVRASNERIMDFATLSAQQRVVSEIIRMAGPDAANPNVWTIYPFPTQAAIASRVGATRETVARVLSDLSKGGLIRKKEKTLYLDNREGLHMLLERLTD